MKRNHRISKCILTVLLAASPLAFVVFGICTIPSQQDAAWQAIQPRRSVDSNNSSAHAPLPTEPGEGLPANGEVEHDSNLPRGVFVRKSAPLASLLRAVRVSHTWLHYSSGIGLPREGCSSRTSLQILFCTWLT